MQALVDGKVGNEAQCFTIESDAIIWPYGYHAARNPLRVLDCHRHSSGRAFYDRKRERGTTAKEARRALKRRVTDAVFAQLRADQARSGPGRANGGDSAIQRGRHQTAETKVPAAQALEAQATEGRGSTAICGSVLARTHARRAVCARGTR